MSVLLARLRLDSAAQHEALHVHALLAPLHAPVITLGEYTRAIAAFDAAYRHVQVSHADDGTLPDAPNRSWLEADMARHGIVKLEASAAPVVIDSLPRYLGYLYVKQGSTLGGQVISRNLQRVLGLEPGADNRFFHGYGSDTGAQWKAFVAGLAGLENEVSADDVSEAACTMFEHIAHFCNLALDVRHAETAPRTD